MLNKKLFFLSIFIFSFIFSFSQENLLDLLNNKPKTTFASSTFKETKVINLQSNETPAKNQLQFIISHRFGKLNDGAYQLWGLDNSQIRFHLSYGITDWFSAGLGRSSNNKVYDGWAKYKLLKQSTGNKNIPFSLTGYNAIFIKTKKDFSIPDSCLCLNKKISYAHQLIIARKFSKKTSVEIVPTLLHYNSVDSSSYSNDIFAISIGARQKLNSSISLNLEYNYLLTKKNPNNTNSLSIGFDIETGGHIFQLHLTNAKGMIESEFIGENTGKWKNGDIYFGFNISRQFNLKKNKKY